MLEALKTAPEDAEGFRKTVRWNLGAWLGQVHKPLRISREHAVLALTSASAPTARRSQRASIRVIVTVATPIVLWDTASGQSSELSPVRSPRSPSGRTARSSFAVAEPRGVRGHRTRDGAGALDEPGVTWRVTRRQIDLSSDGSTVLAHRMSSRIGLHWLFRLDAATGQPRGEPLELPGLGAVAPGGGTAAARRIENGEARIDLHELPSGRRLASWRTGENDLGYYLVDLAFSVPMEGRCSVAFAEGESSIRMTVDVSQIWDPGTWTADSVRSWQARPFPSTLPPPIGC